jgi:hypothetical protein
MNSASGQDVLVENHRTLLFLYSMRIVENDRLLKVRTLINDDIRMHLACMTRGGPPDSGEAGKKCVTPVREVAMQYILAHISIGIDQITI